MSAAGIHMDGGITLDLALNILGGKSSSDSNKKWLDELAKADERGNRFRL